MLLQSGQLPAKTRMAIGEGHLKHVMSAIDLQSQEILRLRSALDVAKATHDECFEAAEKAAIGVHLGTLRETLAFHLGVLKEMRRHSEAVRIEMESLLNDDLS